MGKKLSDLRQRAGLTQAEVARRLNVDQSAVSKWETGKSPPLQKYRAQLAALYGVNESELTENQ